jgi:autotransporter-associated beta strand protein
MHENKTQSDNKGIRRCRPTRSGRNLATLLMVGGIIFTSQPAYAGSGTWIVNPVNNSWNTPANWSSNTVPGGLDTATFKFSEITDISISGNSGAQTLLLDVDANAYSFTALPGAVMDVGDGGIMNLSGLEQNFIAQADSAGQAGVFIVDGFGGIFGEGVVFTEYGAMVPGINSGAVFFSGDNSAGTASCHNLGGTVSGAAGGLVAIGNRCDAGESTIINEGGEVSGAGGGETIFEVADPSAANATIIANGSSVSGASGGLISFFNSSVGADSTLIANGGSNGGGGGAIFFRDSSDGGKARVEVFGNGALDVTLSSQRSIAVGSIEGDGLVVLAANELTVGANGNSTIFSGLISDANGPGGSIVKTGRGSLTLTGANAYVGGTTLQRGSLVVTNTSGSATGTGAVSVTAGTLGGSGIIAGAVTVGTGSGSGAFLAPAHGGNKQLTLTIQGSVTFNADATYTYTFKAKGNRSKTDKVVANGVTINSGATFNLSGTAQGTLIQGTVLTVIKNTAATPIAGTFSNLPDGAIVTVNGNNLQASYEGGDGNDLTLTVVP